MPRNQNRKRRLIAGRDADAAAPEHDHRRDSRSIRSDLQEAAALALGDLPGAVVAVEPETGDVLALVANPSYDPNTISSGTDEDIAAAWESISTDPSQPLISRAKDELYLPGSTGKLITASAAPNARSKTGR